MDRKQAEGNLALRRAELSAILECGCRCHQTHCVMHSEACCLGSCHNLADKRAEVERLERELARVDSLAGSTRSVLQAAVA